MSGGAGDRLLPFPRSVLMVPASLHFTHAADGNTEMPEMGPPWGRPELSCGPRAVDLGEITVANAWAPCTLLVRKQAISFFSLFLVIFHCLGSRY